jgi:putative ABC transport system substrate-binding protein
MKRREFITFVVGVTIALPRAARAQQSDQRRHIGVMTGLPEDDPENQARLAGFRHGLEKRGWSEGRNLRIDYRFAPAASPDQVQLSAKELAAMRPDVIFANATPIVAALQRETRAISIVFAAVADPIGSGFIASLPQPGGNITGVMLYEPSVTGKWLSMLKEIAPQLVRAAFLINPRSASFYNYYLRTAEPDLIVALAARHRLPAVYSVRFKDEREHATPIQSAKSVSKTTDRPQYRFRD